MGLARAACPRCVQHLGFHFIGIVPSEATSSNRNRYRDRFHFPRQYSVEWIGPHEAIDIGHADGQAVDVELYVS